MCGIWALLQQIPIKNFGELYTAFMKIKHRGPDYSSFDLICDNLLLGFHRLAIMDLSAEGNQPFHHVREDGSCVYCICNGEIYDYEELKKEYGIVTKSHSDCEVIIPLYEKLGVDGMIRLLGSEFAFVIVDIAKDGHVKMIMGRDPIGVRPLFYGVNDDGLCVSSEMKGLCDIYEKVYVFPPGHYMTYEDGKMQLVEYYSYDFKVMDVVPDMEVVYAEIRKRFTNAVRKRLTTDRPIGALLSGGLDSSLVVCTMKKLMPDKKFPVYTITIDGKGTDLPFAKIVADYLELEHIIIDVTEEQVLEAIDTVVYLLESWDITTIRASLAQYIICNYIRVNDDTKVILGGDNSDECNSGYRYSLYASCASDVKEDCINLVKEVHKYDGKRADRTSAWSGLEIRLPFADPEYVDYIFSLPADLIAPINGIEKYTLREAFAGVDLLPEIIRTRTKETLSDACSGTQRSLRHMVQEHLDKLVSDEEFESEKNKFTFCTPPTKEAFYYRKKFVEYFGDSIEKVSIVPHYWMPKWTNVTDPSARCMSVNQ